MDECPKCHDMREHVEKLTAMLDELTPCSENCDVIAFGAWVDPSDVERTRAMRSRLRELLRECRDVLRQAAANASDCTKAEPVDPISCAVLMNMAKRIDEALSPKEK